MQTSASISTSVHAAALRGACKRLARLGLLIGMVTALAGAAAQNVEGDPKAPLAGRVYGTVIHTADAEVLRDDVLRQLTERYAAEKGLSVTAAEQRAYVKRMQAALRQDREQRIARRDALNRRLAAGGLSEAERRKLAAEVEELNQAIAALADGAGSAASAEDRQARQQIAAAFILQWKINRALYRQYGGRIAYQQGGPEPVDAYRLFLEERQARGDFAIYDPKLEAPFWSYYRDNSKHSFYPRGSRQEVEAFKTPWASTK
jgi:hypothetical protein